jgi:hypothetical protein
MQEDNQKSATNVDALTALLAFLVIDFNIGACRRVMKYKAEQLSMTLERDHE